jgi:hypothetical protein
VLIVGVGSYPYFPTNGRSRAVGQIDSAALGAKAVVRWFLDHYRNPDAPLQTVRVLLSDHAKAQHAHPRLHCVVDRATYPNLQAAYDNWIDDATAEQDSVAIFYFGGHGIGNSQAQCLLLENFHQRARSPLDDAVEYANLVTAIENKKELKQAWIFIDACRNSDMLHLVTNAWATSLTAVRCRSTTEAACGAISSFLPGQAKARADWPDNPVLSLRHCARC